MRDYILIPKIINDLKKDIYSTNLNGIFADSAKDKNKISLNIIRSLYIEDRNHFFLIIDELMLRGFQFHTEKPNNILPKTKIELTANIEVNEDLKRHIFIEWDKFGLGGFNKRFSIENDLFFNKIPLSGFQQINRSIDLEAFTMHLEGLNFKVSNTEYIKSENVPNIDFHEKIAETTPKYVSSSENYFFIIGFGHQLIREVFDDKRYNNFVVFCNEKDITYMNELEPRHIEIYKNVDLVTTYRYNLILDKFKRTIFETFKQNRIKEPERVLIESFFMGNDFRLFREFAESAGIKDARDINEEIIKKFSLAPQVGVTKVRSVEKKLKNLEEYVEKRKRDLMPLNRTFIRLKNDYIKELKITEVFHQFKCEKFINYCEENNVISLSDVKVKHLNQFANDQEVNKHIFYNVYIVFKEIEKSDSNSSELFFSAGSLYSEISSFPIKDVSTALGINYLNNYSSITVSDLEGANLSTYTDGRTAKELYSLSQKLMSLIPIKNIIKKVTHGLNEKEFNILILRLRETLTLQEVGEQLNVTRERIRQIQKTIVTKVIKIFEENNFRSSLRLLCEGKPFIYYSDLTQLFDEKIFLIEIFKTDYLYYERSMDAFFLEELEKERYLNKIEEILNQLPSVFLITNYSESFKETISDLHLGLKHWRSLLIENGYKEYGDLYSLDRLNATEIVEKVFETFFNYPVKLDEDSFLEIRKLANEYFNFPIGESLRSFDNRIREADKLLLVDSNTYLFFDPDEDEDIYKDIEEYIDNVLNERQFINAEEIFINFKKQLSEIQVYNKIHLYSLIKYYFEDKYIIGKGNTLNIYNNEGSKLNIEDRLIGFIEEQGGIVTKQVIENKFKWKRNKIDLAISSSEKIITWDTNTVRLYDSIKITDNQKEKLLQIVNENMSNNYTTTAIIYDQMLFNPELSIVLRDNEIDINYKLASIIKLLNPKIKGHQNFLYVEGSIYQSFTDVLKDHFQDMVSREEIFSFIMKHGYKELMAYNQLNDLVDNNVLLEVDIGIFYPTNKLNIPEGTTEVLLDIIKENMGEKPYIILTALEGYRSLLPPINIRWTPHVIKGLLLNEKFRHIKRNPYDYRFDKLILVKNDADIKTFEELIYYILRREYNGNMHETRIYDFIARKGILDYKTYDGGKKLPNEIKRESEFVNVDELGIVSLKEV